MPIYKLDTVVRNNYDADHILTLDDIGRFVDMDVNSPNNVTVPAGADVAWPANVEIVVTQLGTGLTTIVAGVGVTIYSFESRADLAGQYASCTLSRLGDNIWLLVGNIA